MYSQLVRIQQADGILFAEYWQLNTLVHALKKRIFPSLSTYMIGHDKVEMSRCFLALEPAHVPHTEILANTPTNADWAWEQMLLPFVAKFPRASMGHGVFLIETQRQWRDYLDRTPVIYVQEYLPIDRDLRIVWVGKKVLGGYWRLQAEKGFYNNVAQGGAIVEGLIPPAALALVARLALALNIDHGGFDIAMVGDHPYIFEFNRIFGNQGLAGKQGVIDQEILAYVSANWSREREENSLREGQVAPHGIF